MSRATMVAALLGMGFAVPDSAATPAGVDTSAVAAPQSPAGGSPMAVDRLPGGPEELMGAPFTVEAIDRPGRLMIARSPDGTRRTIRVAPTAEDFDVVQTGSRLTVDYYPASLVSLGSAKPVADESDQTPTRANAPVLAAAGARQITTKAHVTHADGESGTLEVTTAGGNPHVLSVNDPAARASLRSLTEGDQVTVTYTEAVAVGLHDASGS